MKAIEMFKENDEMKEQQGETFFELIDKIPFNNVIDSEPDINPVRKLSFLK